MGFEQLVEPVYPELLRYARAMAGSKPDGDDLLQTALIKGWRGLDSLRDPDGFKVWMLRIIRNTYRSRKRKKWLRNLVSLDSITDRPADQELPFDEKDAVRLALQALPVKQRDAVALFEVLGLSVNEVASIQQTSPSAVKSRLSRGRAKLRERYLELTEQETGHEAEIAQTS